MRFISHDALVGRRRSCKSTNSSRQTENCHVLLNCQIELRTNVLRRILLLLVAAPVAIFLVTLAVANRHDVQLILDPFRPENPVISLALPFYAYLFGTLILGILVGGASVWFGQGHWRKAARQRTQEARRWRSEADRLSRERDASVAAGNDTKQLAMIGR